ncbi:Crp/Fnr family transcriptional regulator [Enterococcus faecalis]|uniref:Crp/Fnr family transcriptional regulator n=1 Tax=Enterococcus faecalis TaxID=1351 RepID=UPI003D0F5AC4
MYTKRNLFQKLQKKYLDNNAQFFEIIKKKHTKQLTRVSFDQGEIIDSYLKPNTLYYINKGVVMRSFYDYEGNHRALDTVREKEFIGLSTLLGSIPAYWETEVLEYCELFVIPESIVANYPQQAYQILGINHQYHITSLYVSWQEMLSTGKERINYALLNLVSRPENSLDENYFFPNYVTHEMISKFAAVSRSYVTRHILDLEKEGILHREKNKMFIRNIDELFVTTPNYSALYEIESD